MELREKILWGIAIVAGLAAIFMYADTNQTRKEIIEVREEIKSVNGDIKKLESIENLYKNYGRGSSDYYSDVPLIVLNKGGNQKNIPVYWGTGGTFSYSWNKNISVEQSEPWNDHRTSFKVTSGDQRGCYKVTFTNKVNSDAFDVLVVVK